MKHKPFIHPATPTKLKTAFRRVGYKFHTLAQARGINVKYVYELIHKGKEPGNPAIRIKLFLPRKPHKSKDVKPYIEPPEYITWWRHQTKQLRHEIILQAKSRQDATESVACLPGKAARDVD